MQDLTPGSCFRPPVSQGQRTRTARCLEAGLLLFSFKAVFEDLLGARQLPRIHGGPHFIIVTSYLHHRVTLHFLFTGPSKSSPTVIQLHNGPMPSTIWPSQFSPARRPSGRPFDSHHQAGNTPNYNVTSAAVRRTSERIRKLSPIFGFPIGQSFQHDKVQHGTPKTLSSSNAADLFVLSLHEAAADSANRSPWMP